MLRNNLNQGDCGPIRDTVELTLRLTSYFETDRLWNRLTREISANNTAEPPANNPTQLIVLKKKKIKGDQTGLKEFEGTGQ
jgi:hypothetical protein